MVPARPNGVGRSGGERGAEELVWSVYVLQNVRGMHYVGMSEDVPRRLREHNAGAVKSAKSGRPRIVIFEERIGARHEARIRERYWKSGAGRRKIATIPTSFPGSSMVERAAVNR
jgi:putative endonuclease